MYKIIFIGLFVILEEVIFFYYINKLYFNNNINKKRGCYINKNNIIINYDTDNSEENKGYNICNIYKTYLNEAFNKKIEDNGFDPEVYN